MERLPWLTSRELGRSTNIQETRPSWSCHTSSTRSSSGMVSATNTGSMPTTQVEFLSNSRGHGDIISLQFCASIRWQKFSATQRIRLTGTKPSTSPTFSSNWRTAGKSTPQPCSVAPVEVSASVTWLQRQTPCFLETGSSGWQRSGWTTR